jgi:hypothetical protein
MNKQKLGIGTRIYGFEFEDKIYNKGKLRFNPDMNDYIGLIGEIINYDKDANTYQIQFNNGVGWYYPGELIEQHVLIKKDKTYTRDEVIELLNKLNHTLNIVDKPEEGYQTLEEWIENNL